MKKLFAVMMMVALMTSCTNDENLKVVKKKPTTTTPTGLVARAVTMDCATATTMKTVIARGTDANSIVSPEKPTQLTTEQLVKYTDLFFKEFPAGKPNLNIDHSGLESFTPNFSAMSDGNGIDIYPINVGGNAGNTLGIYYYKTVEKDGKMVVEMVEEDIWVYGKDYTEQGNAGNEWSALQDGNGITLNLPANTIYGFYIKNTHPYGTAFAKNIPFYSDASKNYDNQLHAVTFVKDGEMFVGFEDLTIGGKGCDVDYNDVIFLITPRQPIVTGIEIEIDDNFVCTSDDFNLNLGDNKEYVAIPSSNGGKEFAFNGKIFIANYDLSATNDSDELAFKLRLYNKEAWPEDMNGKPSPIALALDKIKNLPPGFEVKEATKSYGHEGGNVAYLQVDLILTKK